MITEIPITEFNGKLKYKKLEYPQCTCGKCFKMFFNMVCCASRQSGKTHCIARIIQHYTDNIIKDSEGNVVKCRTFIISSTLDANPVLTSLKSVDVENDTYPEYSDAVIEEIMGDIARVKQECQEYKDYKKAYNKYMKLKVNEINKLTDDELQILNKHNFEDYQKIDKPRWGETPPINFLVFDDILGTKALSSSKRSKLMNLYIKNRHLQCVCILAVQSMRGLSREIRLNTSVFFLGKFANKKIVLEDMFEEVSNVVPSIDVFEELYDKATEEKYGALIIDLTDGKRFMKNLDSILEIE
jgi:hypothetical protein